MASKQSSGGSIPVVLRVKRKRTEEPAEALIIACKVRKLDAFDGKGQTNEGGNMFHFAGTVQTPKESPKEVLTSVSQLRDHSALVKLSPFSKLSISDHQEEQRGAKKALSSQRRFKLVSQYRSLEGETPQSAEEAQIGKEDSKPRIKEVVCLYDLEEETDMSDGVCGSGQGKSVAEALNGDGDKSIITCNSSPMVREKVPAGNEFVYDLYFAHTRSVADTSLYNWTHISACSYDQELVHENLDEGECYDEEEDSNDEGHWKNDYPDEIYSDEEEAEAGEDSLEEGYRGKDSYLGDNEENSYVDGNYWDERD